jgi:hypothetical protein
MESSRSLLDLESQQQEASMSALQVAKLQCIEETNEIGDDDIYFILGIGRRSTASKKGEIKVVGPGQAWEDLSTGDVRNQDVTIDSAFHAQDFYVITMVERDNGKDIVGSELDNVKNTFGSLWQTWGVSVQGLTDSQIFGKMQNQINLVIGGAGNDDLVGSTQLLQKPSKSSSTTMTFKGDGGKYKVWFKLV